jgi:hypothetical protein
MPIILVKFPLIGKSAAAPRANMRAFALYFRLAFILSKQRAIMVNAFTLSRARPMNFALSGLRLQQKEIRFGWGR